MYMYTIFRNDVDGGSCDDDVDGDDDVDDDDDGYNNDGVVDMTMTIHQNYHRIIIMGSDDEAWLKKAATMQQA